MNYVLKMKVIQVEDGTWRIVIFGKDRDLLSDPFATREEAVNAIMSLESVRIYDHHHRTIGLSTI